MSTVVFGWRARLSGALLLVSMLLAGLVPAASAQIATWSPGPLATGDSSIIGVIEAPTSGASLSSSGFNVHGWVVDRSAQGWAGIVEVHVYDGLAGQGGTFLGAAQVALPRPDVGAALGNGYWNNSGFSLDVPAGKAPSGGRTLTVYARTEQRGWWYSQTNVNVNQAPAYPNDPVLAILAPVPGERVKTDRDYQIRGYAFDRNTPSGSGSGIDLVQVYVDDPKTSTTARLLGEATLDQQSDEAGAFGSQFQTAGWVLTISPTKLSSDQHTLFVYARSKITGKENVQTVNFTIYD